MRYRQQTPQSLIDYSIGIELEGADQIDFTAQQYTSLKTVIALLRKNYAAIRHDNIVGHSDIAPGRKTDPGPAFDWQRLALELIQNEV